MRKTLSNEPRSTPTPCHAPYTPTVAIIEQDGGLYAWIIESPTPKGTCHD